MADGLKIAWVENDIISIFDGTINAKYVTKAAGAKAAFQVAQDAEGVNPAAPSFVALYPYNADATMEGNVISTVIPNLQYGIKDGFDNKGLVMVSKATDTTFLMKNVVALLKITIPEDVTSVMIGNLDGVPMAGKTQITIGDDGTPTSISATAENILLIPTSGNETFEAGDYYVAAAPGSITTGLSVCMSKKDEESLWIKDGSSPCVLRRSHLMNLGDLDAVTEEVPTVVVRLPFSDGTTFTNAFSYPEKFANSEASANYIGQNIFYAKDDWDSFQYASYGKRGYTQNNAGGFRMARDEGDYLELPAINGCKLVAVHAWLGGGGLILHGLTDTDSVVVNGGSAYQRSVNTGDNFWFHNIQPSAATHYLIRAQKDNTRWLAMRTGEFYYSGTPTATVAFVKTELPAPEGTKATLKGSMGMFFGDFSDATCGFEYRTAAGTEWTSVECDEADENFSKLLELPVGDYVYRAWAKAGSVKLYGTEANVSFFTGLSLDIICGPYIPTKSGTPAYKNGYWFPSNSQAAATTGDNAKYNNTKRVLEYDFLTGYNFHLWADYGISRATATVDGQSVLYGMRYNPSTLGTAWMQFPAISGMRLKSVTWKARTAKSYYVWNVVSALTPDNAETPTSWTVATGAKNFGKMSFTSSSTLEQAVTLTGSELGVGNYEITDSTLSNFDIQEIHLVYTQD